MHHAPSVHVRPWQVGVTWALLVLAGCPAPDGTEDMGMGGGGDAAVPDGGMALPDAAAGDGPAAGKDDGGAMAGCIQPVMGRADIDIPTVLVTGAATVATLPAANARYWVGLRRDPGDLVKMERATDTMGYGLRLIPGSYALYYDAPANGPVKASPAPANNSALIAGGLALKADETYDVDFPAVGIHGAVTVDGKSSMSKWGRVYLRDTVTGDLFLISRTSDPSYAASVVPGSYDIVYSWERGDVDAPPPVPMNTFAVLQKGVKIDSARALDIDIKTVLITGTPTVKGLPVAGAKFWIGLRNGDGDLAQMERVMDGNDYALRIVPGTYDIYYYIRPGGLVPVAPAPANRNALLHKGVALTTTRTYDIDIPAVGVHGKVTVNGATTTSKWGRVYLRDPATADLVLVSRTNDASYSASVVPGSYDVVYSWERGDVEPLPPVPMNRFAVLQKGVKIDSARALDVDLPMVTISGAATVAGLPEGNAKYWVAFRNGDGDFAKMERVTDTLGYGVRIVPGTYDLYYDAPSKDWTKMSPSPANNTMLVTKAVVLDKTKTYDVDFPASGLHGKITVDGKTSMSKWGRVLLEDPATGDAFLISRTNDPSYAASVVPGTYDIVYSWERGDVDTPAPVPMNRHARLGCLILR